MYKLFVIIFCLLCCSCQRVFKDKPVVPIVTTSPEEIIDVEPEPYEEKLFADEKGAYKGIYSYYVNDLSDEHLLEICSILDKTNYKKNLSSLSQYDNFDINIEDIQTNVKLIKINNQFSCLTTFIQYEHHKEIHIYCLKKDNQSRYIMYYKTTHANHEVPPFITDYFKQENSIIYLEKDFDGYVLNEDGVYIKPFIEFDEYIYDEKDNLQTCMDKAIGYAMTHDIDHPDATYIDIEPLYYFKDNSLSFIEIFVTTPYTIEAHSYTYNEDYIKNLGYKYKRSGYIKDKPPLKDGEIFDWGNGIKYYREGNIVTITY